MSLSHRSRHDQSSWKRLFCGDDYRTETVIGAGTIATLLAVSNYCRPVYRNVAGMAAPFAWFLD